MPAETINIGSGPNSRDGDPIRVAFQKTKRKIDGILSPEAFGAVGNGIADDTTPVQEFLDSLVSTKSEFASASGRYRISSGLVFDGGQSGPQTKRIVGNMTIVANGAIDTLLTINNFGGCEWDGVIELVGTGSTSYTTRTCRQGVEISRSGRARFGGFYARNFFGNGVRISSDVGNSNLLSLGRVQALQCGSGAPMANSSLTATWTNRTDAGSADSGLQTSTVDVTSLPLESVLSDRAAVLTAIIDDEPYIIRSIDRGNSRIQVSPWLDLNRTTGTVKYVFGGALAFRGSDAGVIGVDLVDATICGTGVDMMALYGPVVGRMVAQNVGVGLLYGLRTDSSMVTSSIQAFYGEANHVDVFQLTAALNDGGWIIGSEFAFEPSKAFAGSARRSNNSLLYSDFKVLMQKAGQLMPWEKRPRNRAEQFSRYDLVIGNTPHRSIVFSKDSWTVRLIKSNQDWNRLYGYDSAEIVFLGSGSNSAPSGSFVFDLPSGATQTINGQSSVTFSGFDGPAVFVIKYDWASDAYRVGCVKRS
jgi:hypothetical protein